MKPMLTKNHKNDQSNQNITKDFFLVILGVIARNSSKSYGFVILQNIKENYTKEFPFFSFVKVKEQDIEVDEAINSINEKKIGKLFMRIINTLGQDISEILIKEELNEKRTKYLNKLGVKI